MEKYFKTGICFLLTLFCFITSVNAQESVTESVEEKTDETAVEEAAESSPSLFKTYPVLFEAKHKAVLSAELAGSLTSVKFDVGDNIKKGAVIASVDTGELVLKRKRSELALNHLEVQVKDLTNLKQKGLATNDDLAKARMERDVTRTEIDIYRRQIGKSSIRAPFNGMVVRRHVQAHEWVTEGQPVMDVVSLDTLRAVANIPAHLAVNLQKGETHPLYVNDLDSEVMGKVMAVAPEVDERSNTAQVIWTVEKGEKNLLPGMKGEVRIEQH